MVDKLTDIIRVGKVSAIDAKTGKAKITFEDRDDSVSAFLFVTVPCTLKDKFYYMPSIDERVTVIYNPDAPTNGRILGSFYADTRLPPYPDENKFYINFEDKTLLEYDKKLNRLTIKIEKKNDTSIEVETASDISIKSGGKVLLKVAEEVELDCVKDITVKAGANVGITIKGDASIQVEGNTDITAKDKINVTSTEDISIISKENLLLKGKSSSMTL